MYLQVTSTMQEAQLLVNYKITVGSEAEKRQYELPKISIERFSGSEVFLKIPYAELGNYELKKEVELGKS
jgi:hypothetical protein